MKIEPLSVITFLSLRNYKNNFVIIAFWRIVIKRFLSICLFPLILCAAVGNAQAQDIEKIVDAILSSAGANNDSGIIELKSKIYSLQKPLTGDRKKARELNSVGIKELNGANYALADEAFSKASLADPSDKEIAANLGYSLLKGKHYEAAKDAIYQAILLSPDRLGNWYALGQVYGNQGNESKALASFITASVFANNKPGVIDVLNRIANDPDANSHLISAANNAIARLSASQVSENQEAPSSQTALPPDQSEAEQQPTATAELHSTQPEEPPQQLSTPETPAQNISESQSKKDSEYDGWVNSLIKIIGTYIAILFLSYFIPTFIAFIRGHDSKWGIFLLNLLLGWSFIGWVIALVWSFSRANSAQQMVINQSIEAQSNHVNAPTSNAPTQMDRLALLKKLNHLKTSGALTDEEFQEEKRNILGSNSDYPRLSK